MATVDLGPAIFALGGLMVIMVLADYTLDDQAVWEAMEPRNRRPPPRPGRQSRHTRPSGAEPASLAHRLRHVRAGQPSGAGHAVLALRIPSARPQAGLDQRTWAFAIAAHAALYPGQHLSRADRRSARRRSAQHHPGRRAGVDRGRDVAAGGTGVFRQRRGAGAEAGRAGHTADLHPFRDRLGAARPHGALPDRRCHRTVVDDRHFHGVDPGGSGAVRTACQRLSRAGCDRLRRRGDPDHAGGAKLRSAADVGQRPYAGGRWHERPVIQPLVVRSRIDRKSRLSLIWAIPVVTVIIGAWLAWRTISQRGPLITITFETAEGLQANQSHVRHKDVDMGVVQKVSLTPDLKRVQVTVRMNSEAEPLLTDQAQFWVVRPRFFAGSISGLQTLFSGSYIDLLPASEGGEAEARFRRPGKPAGAAIRRAGTDLPAEGQPHRLAQPRVADHVPRPGGW